MPYANDKSCANIIGVIADTIREHTAAQVSSAQYMSFIIDGDTDVSVKECEIVYVRILVVGQLTNILVGHVEVEHASADASTPTKRVRTQSQGEISQQIEDPVLAALNNIQTSLSDMDARIQTLESSSPATIPRLFSQ
ncbi:hypothetical protein SKAU_G00285780 [Synaphobranchus kaupii]|uniref:Uncharacterized protein n=1 Tax=Synaphobranchus kaupii TaxID=118154 RepID=A0A9Q1EXZ5_SYNKA|nr:hypothetical protein SKAU_G00285780 [Synaphobranchus kaupii]